MMATPMVTTSATGFLRILFTSRRKMAKTVCITPPEPVCRVRRCAGASVSACAAPLLPNPTIILCRPLGRASKAAEQITLFDTYNGHEPTCEGLQSICWSHGFAVCFYNERNQANELSHSTRGESVGITWQACAIARNAQRRYYPGLYRRCDWHGNRMRINVLSAGTVRQKP